MRDSIRISQPGLTTAFLESSPRFDKLLSLYNVKYLLSGWPLSNPRKIEYLGRVGKVASLNGEPTRVLRANHSLRGVVVPKGIHEVHFEFRSPSIALGAGVSLVGLLGLAAAAWWLRKA